MKLDRNNNGRGKYALVNLRKLSHPHHEKLLTELAEAGLITFGNESPGDQFFVMKYKDRFTLEGLKGYARAVRSEVLLSPLASDKRNSLKGYAEQIEHEAKIAASITCNIPD